MTGAVRISMIPAGQPYGDATMTAQTHGTVGQGGSKESAPREQELFWEHSCDFRQSNHGALICVCVLDTEIVQATRKITLDCQSPYSVSSECLMQLGTIGRYRRTGWITDARLEPVPDMLLSTVLRAIPEALKQSLAAAKLGLELCIQCARPAAPADANHRLDYGSIALCVDLARLFRTVREAHSRTGAFRDMTALKKATGSTANRETTAAALPEDAAEGTMPEQAAHKISSPASMVTNATAAIHVCTPEAVVKSDPEL